MLEWISVKDRLPEGGEDGLETGIEDVLIAYQRLCDKCQHETEDLYIYIGYYIDDEWKLAEPLLDDIFSQEHNEQIIITHWMPLLESPK